MYHHTVIMQGMKMGASGSRDGETGGIQVIARAAAILRALQPGGMSLSTLARATGLPRSTVQRIVEALDREGFVDTGPDGVRPGWGLQHLAGAGQSNIVPLLRPFLETLFEQTNETVDVSTRNGREVVFLDRIVSTQALRAVPVTDRANPLHAMANGKALLSCMTDAQVTELMGPDWLRLTDATRTHLAELLTELGEIRGTGLAFDQEEHAVGVCAVGTPISLPGLRPYALSVALPASRFVAGREWIGTALLKCRRAVEAELTRD